MAMGEATKTSNRDISQGESFPPFFESGGVFGHQNDFTIGTKELNSVA